MGAPRRRALAPGFGHTSNREEGGGDQGASFTEEIAMSLLSWRGWKASLVFVSVVPAACGGGNQSAPPLAGRNTGTTQATFWTAHTPPHPHSLKPIPDPFP